MAIQSERSFSGEKFNNTSRNDWKPLFEVNFSKNSTKKIGLFALDIYDVIVDSAFGLINYHLRNLELIILLLYKNTIINQSARVFSLSYFLKSYKGEERITPI